MTQPGYDALAQRYADTFPNAYQTALERHTMHAFADLVTAADLSGVVVDVGCGIGHVTADLADRGVPILGVEPSRPMLSLARDAHPDCEFVCDDALLASLPADLPIAAIVARFSLIHVPPQAVDDVLASWARRITPNGLLLVAAQCTDDATVTEFDHAVAPAWRWHPDHLSHTLRAAGFAEAWRVIARADSRREFARFDEVHLTARRMPPTAG